MEFIGYSNHYYTPLLTYSNYVTYHNTYIIPLLYPLTITIYHYDLSRNLWDPGFPDRPSE